MWCGVLQTSAPRLMRTREALRHKLYPDKVIIKLDRLVLFSRYSRIGKKITAVIIVELCKPTQGVGYG